MIFSRIFLYIAAIFALLIACGLPCNAQVKPPNIIVIVADDMGYADIGVHGSKDIPTPNIDSLAKNGVRFTDAYVSGPYCSPTRAGLMTGKYPQRFGHEFNILGHREEHHNAGLPLTERTMADHLKAAGYNTALFGKWHLGESPHFRPMERGFEEFFGFLRAQHSYKSPTVTNNNPLYDGNKPVAESDYLTDVLADRAAEFIKRKRTQPFFLYLAFNAVHTPMEASEKYLARFAHIRDEPRRTYAAMLAAMDDGIGKTLESLRAANLEENTLIFFFSDNGGPTLVGGENGSNNAPLKGSKRTTWEGGIRVPFIVQWKGRIAGGKTYSHPVIQLDVLPTALAAAGLKSQPQSSFDGVNLLPFLNGKSSGRRPHDTLYWRLGGIMAIRKGDWKLMRMSENGFREEPRGLDGLTGLELYNLKNDIGESQDLISKNQKLASAMAGDWQKWAKGLGKPGWPPLTPLGEVP